MFTSLHSSLGVVVLYFDRIEQLQQPSPDQQRERKRDEKEKGSKIKEEIGLPSIEACTLDGGITGIQKTMIQFDCICLHFIIIRIVSLSQSEWPSSHAHMWGEA